MGSNCAQCLSLDDQYGCEYCGAAFGRPGTCNFLQLDRDQCERDSLVEFEAIGDCDPPSIADVSINYRTYVVLHSRLTSDRDAKV